MHILMLIILAMAGVAAIRNVTTLHEETLDHESAARWTEALTCYSQMLQADPDLLSNHTGTH